jgi:hypothetical protein
VLYGSADAVATEPLAGLGLPVTITGADDVGRLGAQAPAEQLAQPFGGAVKELVQALVAMA